MSEIDRWLTSEKAKKTSESCWARVKGSNFNEQRFQGEKYRKFDSFQLYIDVCDSPMNCQKNETAELYGCECSRMIQYNIFLVISKSMREKNGCIHFIITFWNLKSSPIFNWVFLDFLKVLMYLIMIFIKSF